MGEPAGRRIELGRCRSCREPIVWAKTERGQTIPVDPEPRVDGNLVLRFLAADGPAIAHVLGADEDATGESRYVSHFATCPDAARFRRRRAA